MLRKLSSISDKRLALYGVATGAALAAGLPHIDAVPVTLDLTGLSLATRTTPTGGYVFFDVNAASATAAVGFAPFAGADFGLFNNSNVVSAGVSGLSGNRVAYDAPGFKATRFGSSNYVGPGNSFNAVGKIGGSMFGNFAPGDTGYIGLRFTITGTDTHYAWANIHLNSDYTVVLNALSYESDPDTSIHVPGAVPDQGSTLALLAIGAAGLLAFRRMQRKTA